VAVPDFKARVCAQPLRDAGMHTIGINLRNDRILPLVDVLAPDCDVDWFGHRAKMNLVVTISKMRPDFPTRKPRISGRTLFLSSLPGFQISPESPKGGMPNELT
jgi:hypothetical protein